MNILKKNRCVLAFSKASDHGNLSRQGGMGATIILFTIALIVLVGAALAYASRGNPQVITVQSAKVYSAVILKQGADYRNAYYRYIFDGGVAANMTFNNVGGPMTSVDLFWPASQYATYQTAPPQSTTSNTPSWLYIASVVVAGVGTTGPESIVYTSNLTPAVCAAINDQLYGVGSATAIPSAGVTLATLASGISAAGRASGCVATTDTPPINLAYVTLAES